MQEAFNTFLFDIFGLVDETEDAAAAQNDELLDKVVGVMLDMRETARQNKDWGTSDQIRDRLAEIGIQIKDSKTGATWKTIE